MLKFVLLLQFNVHAKKGSEVKETTKTWNIKPPVQPGKKETSNVGERHWAEFYITYCMCLNRLSHRTHKNPLDEQTRLEYLLTRSQYKQLLRTKKLQHRNNKIDEPVKTRHPLNFWTTLKSLSTQVEKFTWFECSYARTVYSFLKFPAPKKLTTRNAVRDKQTILSPFIELTN